MANRVRNERLEIKLSEEEMQMFKEKMKLSKSRTMAHFIRKCVLEKEIYYVGLEPFRDIQWSLSNVTNNINQIAKHVNQTGVIYKKDMEAIRKDVDKISKEVWDIHSLLLKRIQKIQEY
ncbi:MAG: MobC family plasmid mobilization relaxosome protein [Tissierellia bacterium]|nr:MobC family plasmid mobilization relaxosome protein [Tissierellia bacterium]